MYIGGGLLPFGSSSDPSAAWKQPQPPAFREEAPARSGASFGASHASTEAGATSVARRALELKMLLSFLPEPLRALLFPCLLTLATTAVPFSHEGLAARDLAWQYNQRLLRECDISWLRTWLVKELRLGLVLAEQPSVWCVRPVRNLRLAMQAARIGQLVWALRRRAEALLLTDEFYHALMVLQRAAWL